MPPLMELAPGLSAAGALTRDDIEALAAAGVKTIINNRPDGEDPGQLPAGEARRLAAAHGIAYHHIPFVGATLTAADVDGLCGSNFQASPQYVQEGLGIPALTWWCSAWGPFTQLLSEAVHAVFAGACSVAVVYQGQVRTVRTSSSVDMTDPVRSVPDRGRSFDHHSDAQYYRPYGGRRGTYAGYMNRYMNEYHVPRESFGLVAVNNRSHATVNPQWAR